MVAANFVQRQWRDVRQGGPNALRHKFGILQRRIQRVVVVLLVSPVFFLPLIVIRCLRPWFLIRFGELETSGIGHLALPVEIYLSELECGLHHPDKKFIDVWCVQDVISNEVLLDKWSRRLTILPRWLIKPLSLLNQWIPGGRPHEIPYRHVTNIHAPWQFCDVHNVLHSVPSHITFSKEEESQGLLALKKMGIEKTDPIICFIARDNTYHLDERLIWGHRDSSVETIAKALDCLTYKGYKAIRMGAKVVKQLHSANPSIIDYTSNGLRSELLDLFLISRCKFMVSTVVGLDSLAPVFRRPPVYVNAADFGNADLWVSEALFIPKKFRSVSEKRILPFSKIFKLGVHLFTSTWQFKREGIEWIDNDVDEIRDVIVEMEQRLSGDWVSTPEDGLLQEKFRSLWPGRSAGHRVPKCRIGAEFLRKNRELLQ